LLSLSRASSLLHPVVLNSAAATANAVTSRALLVMILLLLALLGMKNV